MHTTYTSWCCRSWWIFIDFYDIIQQYYWFTILEYNFWNSCMGSHYRYLPWNDDLPGYETYFHTCDKWYLTSMMSLLQSHHLYYWYGSWSQFCSKTCWRNDYWHSVCLLEKSLVLILILDVIRLSLICIYKVVVLFFSLFHKGPI